MGGTSVLVFGFTYPDRVNRLVTGACHHSTGQSFSGGEPYIIANRPSEGNRIAGEVTADPTRENFRRYLSVHLDNQNLVTDDLVEYLHTSYSKALAAMPPARRRRGRGSPHSNLASLHKVKAPTLVIYGRDDRMCSYEVGLTIFNYLADSRMVILKDCGHWPPFEHPDVYNRLVLDFLKNG